MARNSKDTRRRLASGDKDRDPTVQMHQLGGGPWSASSPHSNGQHQNNGTGGNNSSFLQITNNGKTKHRRSPTSTMMTTTTTTSSTINSSSSSSLPLWSLDGLATIKLVLLFVSIASISIALYYQHLLHLREMRVRTPLDSPQMLSENSTSPLVDPDRFWGTYRSQLYFGYVNSFFVFLFFIY